MSFNIIKYLEKAGVDTIRKEIYNKIGSMTYVCEERIGSGFFGRVYAPTISPFMYVTVKDNTRVQLPIVVKESLHPDGYFGVRSATKAKKVYLYSVKDITAEAIMLYFISKFWYEVKLPYAPFIVSVHKCNFEGGMENLPIDHIVTERQGLFDMVSVDFKGEFTDIDIPRKYSRFEHLGHLIDAGINLCDEKYNFALNNGKIKMNIINLINMSVLHVLIAMDYCTRRGLMLTDQHMGNIFVHWIDEWSAVGGRSITKMREICYKLPSGKTVLAPVEHILIKIGDIGTSCLKLNKKVWIMGDVVEDTDQNFDHIIKQYSKYYPPYMKMFGNLKQNMPYDIFKQTIVHDIFKKDKHIGGYSDAIGYVDVDKFPREHELIEQYYTEYITNKKIQDSESTFVIVE